MTLDSGSYRDPAGSVFLYDGQVYRSSSDKAWEALRVLRESGRLDKWIASGDVVATRFVDAVGEEQARLSTANPGWNHFLWHERIPLVSHPAEWSFSMLADAALLHLRLQKNLLGMGLSLKDATAYNVLFNASRPVFIDLLSVERPARLDVWTAYNQFCRMFLYPLLLFARKRIDFARVFLGDIEGADPEWVYSVFGFWRSLRPDLFLDVFAPHALNRGSTDQVRRLKARMTAASGDPAVQRLNLDRLERKIRSLQTAYRPKGLWSDYERKNTYTAESTTEKGRFIADVLADFKPTTVLDLGCNTGTYSIMAAEQGSRVIAVDKDHDCVEKLYRWSRDHRLNIVPFVMDLANPTPGMGFRNRERLPFLERVSAECVFALALLHHLLIAARLPLDVVAEFFADLTNDLLVIEFIEREDQMFQTLLALRDDLYADLTEERFLAVFKPRFDIVRRASLSGTRRHLFLMRKKT